MRKKLPAFKIKTMSQTSLLREILSMKMFYAEKRKSERHRHSSKQNLIKVE